MKSFSLLAFLFAGASLFAQAPQKMSYQMVIRNNNNDIVANQQVGIRISILQGSVTGNAAYTETHTLTTNINGLVSLEIGDGTIVSGSFASINWASGPFFIKSETDPTGGTNYTITGTSQLLSVPYALYAVNAGAAACQGKSHIVISGEMTDAEAAAMIATDAGPQTQFVWIQNTSALTQVNLSAITNLVELKVDKNTKLQTISAPQLASVSSAFSITQNPLLTNVSVPLLAKVDLSYPNVLTIEDNESLPVISFPVLTSVRPAARVVIQINDNKSLASIDFPQLQSASVTIFSNQALVSVSVPALTAGLFSCGNSPLISSISLPSFISGSISCSFNPLLTNISAPNWKVGGGTILSNPLLTALSFPVLERGGVRIEDNSSLASVLLPQLRNSSVYIKNDTSLVTLSFPLLDTAYSIIIVNYRKITSFSLEQLDHCGDIDISGINYTNAHFPQLRHAGNIKINVAQVTSMSFPMLESCSIFQVGNLQVSFVEFPALRRVKSLFFNQPGLTSVTLPLLQNVDEFLSISAPIHTLNISSLDTVGTLAITGTQLNSISLSSLKLVKTQLLLKVPNLTAISFPQLKMVGTLPPQQNAFQPTAYWVEVKGNLASTAVNGLLNQFANMSPAWTGAKINLQQTPPAPPTGQGIVDKATLVSQGNFVTTD